MEISRRGKVKIHRSEGPGWKGVAQGLPWDMLPQYEV